MNPSNGDIYRQLWETLPPPLPYLRLTSSWAQRPHSEDTEDEDDEDDGKDSTVMRLNSLELMSFSEPEAADTDTGVPEVPIFRDTLLAIPGRWDTPLWSEFPVALFPFPLLLALAPLFDAEVFREVINMLRMASRTLFTVL